MLKQIGFTLAASAVLTACGGSDDFYKPSNVTQATVLSSSVASSSAPKSSVASSAAVSSSVASSVVVASSSAASSASALSSSSADMSSSAEASSSAAASSSAPSTSGTTYTFTSLTDWAVNGGGSPNSMMIELNAATGSGVNMIPIDWAENLANKGWKYEARYTLPSPINVVAGTKISFTLAIPQSYITDATAVLQVNFGIAGGTYNYGGAGGGYKTISEAGGVIAGTDFVISETVPADKALSGTTTLGIQLSKAPTNTAIKDKILIKSINIQAP
jgi:hypothetical protein